MKLKFDAPAHHEFELDGTVVANGGGTFTVADDVGQTLLDNPNFPVSAAGGKKPAGSATGQPDNSDKKEA